VGQIAVQSDVQLTNLAIHLTTVILTVIRTKDWYSKGFPIIVTLHPRNVIYINTMQYNAWLLVPSLYNENETARHYNVLINDKSQLKRYVEQI